MNFKYLLPVVAGLSLSTQQGVASLRIDLDDRRPAEVLSKAKSMAQTYQGSNVVGSLLINEGELASAIALDPWTILTAAHMGAFKDISSLTFKLGSNAMLDVKGELPYMRAQTITGKPFFHKDFRWIKDAKDLVFYTNSKNEAFCNGVRLMDSENFTIDQFHNSPFLASQDFEGVDLAIVKLNIPLPKNLDYPEFLPLDYSVSNTLGASLGYGPMKANTQDTSPMLFNINPQEACVKHLISVKVNAYQQPAPLNVHLLHGNYKGILVNGNESFIPTPDLLKTEGLPVGGDSGGPLFIKHNDRPMLAGILSGTYCTKEDPIEDPSHRLLFGSYKQPVFPAWIDVRHYQDWIKSHMGPTK